MSQKVISIPVKEMAHLKVVLATWYAFMRDEAANLSQADFAESLKTPVIFNLEKDEIEILFTGSAELLNRFREHILAKP
jgi:hypothetical protein